VLVVEDAAADPRFAESTIVAGGPMVRFYVGAVLTTTTGFNLGTICVMDTVPRPRPSDRQLEQLKTLADIATGEDPGDGLPVSLVAVIRRYRQTHFKIKVAATAPDPVARLARTVEIIVRETGGEFTATLDGNETFPDIASLRTFWGEARRSAALEALWPRLLFLEQPIARSHALADEVGEALRHWPERPPLLIDESGAEPADTRRALALGYAGVSHKNCKGVIHGVANACLLAQRRQQGQAGMLSGEDLSNVPPVAILQDLVAQVAFGVTSVERNGHHYFAGASQFPAAIQQHLLAHHNDLFNQTAGGWPRLEINGGRIMLGSALRAPFGCAGELDLSDIETESL
jgi:hypothetical protein